MARARYLSSTFFLLLLGGLSSLWLGLGERESAAAPVPTAMTAGDTVAVYGPQQFNGSPGQGQTYVERFTTTPAAGRLYTLHLVNGAADGTHRASKVSIALNGFEIVSENEVTQSVAVLDRPIAVTDVDTLRIKVAGSGSPFITLSVLSTPDSSFNVYGANQYTIPSGTAKTYNESFSLPAGAAAPYRVYVANGAPDGTLRVTSGSITLNGTQIVSTTELTSTVGSLTKVVTLGASNTLGITVNGSVNQFITVRFTATDTTKPTLTITAPPPGAITSQTTITVSGTISDQTATTVAVNGIAATVTNNASYTASVPLANEGGNLLTVVATDASGRQTDSTRTVTRDTHAPSLAVSAPADGMVTKDPTITVSATASDETGVTVNTNGVPLTLGGNGTFSGTVSLVPGSNVLTTTATDGAANTTSIVRSVTRDTVPPVLTVTAPSDGLTTQATDITVSGTVTDLTAVAVTVNGGAVPVTSGEFSTTVALNPGPNTIIVAATDAATNRTTVTRSVTRDVPIPPDPSTVATAIDPTAISSVATSTAFLYTGTDPIQTGVAPGTIDALRGAVIRGRVLDRAGTPLPGVLLTILDHPEFGLTASRADGRFDLAVNGGGELTVRYAKAGYLPAQRLVPARWQDYHELGDVVLVPLDTQVTTVDFSEPAQVARGSVVEDSAGTRQATLIFEQGTGATMLLPDGSTQPLSSMAVRATEYTVGPQGPAAMPAPLPATSAYTYAVDLSVDEALSAGARSVVFTQPVSFYVDNFLHLPPGVTVPVGTYDPTKGKWVAEKDGRVIKILSTSPVQLGASYPDTTAAASQAVLDSLGISAAELDRLGTLYPAGATLWRTELPHFSAVDLNFAFGFPDKSAPPNVSLPPGYPDCRSKTAGSIIGCEAQTLEEDIGVAGTPFSLHYESDRTLGRTVARRVEIPAQTRVDTASLTPSRPLRANEFPAHAIDLTYTLDVAGKRIVAKSPLGSVIPATTLQWDGRDAFGRTINGSARATLSIDLAYSNVYAISTSGGAGGSTFGGGPPLSAIADISREKGVLRQVVEMTLGTWDNRAGLALGGWSLSPHHVYDPVAGVLYLGSGEREAATALGNVARIIPATRGSFCSAFGCGTPIRTRYDLGRPAVDAAGRLYLPYKQDGAGPSAPGKIRVLGPNGVFVDSIPDAGLPVSVAVAPDGTVYFSEPDLHRIRQWRSGVGITPFAGTGTAGFSGDGGPASDAQFNRPGALAVGADGSLFVADENNNRIRRIATNGTITTYAGTGGTGIAPDGGMAIATPVPAPKGVAVAPDGSVVYISTNLVRRVSPDGRVSTVAGFAGSLGPGSTPATSVAFGTLVALAIEPSGSVLFGQSTKVWRATIGGTLEAVAGTGAPRCVVLTQAIVCDKLRDGDVATQTELENLVGLGVGPDGTIYLAETSGASWLAFVRAIRPALPTLSANNMLVASSDGAEVYEFDAVGRHLRTREGFTGKTLLMFDYDGSGHLAAIRDSLGNTTTIERDAAGNPTGITGPFGQHTTIVVDTAGYLSEVEDPAGNRVQLTHTATGLLTELRDPRGNIHRFAYDGVGRLVADSAPDGSAKTLARTARDTGYTVAVSTALGRTTTYAMDVLGDQTERRTITDAAGLTTQRWRTSTGVDSTRTPDGTTLVVSRGADPRFGTQIVVPTQIVVRLPSNDSLKVIHRRITTRSDSANPFAIVEQRDSTLVNGNLFLSVYNAATRRTTNTTPEGRQMFILWDSLGRAQVVRTPGLDSAIYHYDARGRLDRVQIGGQVETYTYDSRGRLATATDPLNRTDSLFYDDADRLVRKVLAGGRVIQLAYDSSGNLTSLAPPGQQEHTFAWTAGDLDSLHTPPSLGDGTWATQFLYDGDRQLSEIRLPDSTTIGIGYDTAGRSSTVTFDRGQLEYSYSPTTGNLTSITAPGGSTLSFTYDGALPKSVTWGGPISGAVETSYNREFRVLSQTVNGANPVSFGYDRDGLLTTAGALGLKRYAQTGFVERDSVGAVLSTWSYDLKGALSAYTATSGGTMLFQSTLVRDSLSRITTMTETVAGTTNAIAISYDTAGRLSEVRRDGVLTATYEYDANGNRLHLTTPNGTITGAYDAQDRLTSYGNATYGYTRAGTLRWKAVGSDTTYYTYDALGNLTAVTLPDGTAITYVIDGQNRRVGKRVNGILTQGFLYQDQIAPIAELDGTGAVISRFVYATRQNVPDYMVKAGTMYRLVTDHLGSVRLVVNSSTGEVVQRLDYDEFGRITENTNPSFQPFGYAGGLADASTGLVRFGTRDYDPETGRWTAKDLLGFDGGDANLYAYVSGDPMNQIDPLGTQQIPEGARCSLEDLGDRLKKLLSKLRKINDIRRKLARLRQLRELKQSIDNTSRLRDEFSNSVNNADENTDFDQLAEQQSQYQHAVKGTSVKLFVAGVKAYAAALKEAIGNGARFSPANASPPIFGPQPYTTPAAPRPLPRN
ncbi:MAG TPA: RHS repeat-associated core domain-containing protein [Gemmatimonadaceae bacterium]|jgi:RHS repeat-associated protein|nr:RHS repeat-associated core domain-containing protein [Gemmatimonadaceae bacterium]